MSRASDRTTEIIRHHWDRRASTFDDTDGHGLLTDEQRQAWLDLLSRITGRAPVRAIDVGCGTGFLAFRLAELGHAVTGIDLSPRMIEQARRKAAREGVRIDFRVGDGVAIDRPDQTYSLLVARHVIWNLPDPARGVAEWLRVLRPGGRMILIEGKWADNDALRLALARPASRALARVIDTAVSLLVRAGRNPTKLLLWKYSRLEAQLPFSGGPAASELAAFLEAQGVQEVSVEPLMDPMLWGEPPAFPRYLVTGMRASAPEAGS
jgi:ubiquinone/menaquinone biosynthesis C-methylase UbiE